MKAVTRYLLTCFLISSATVSGVAQMSQASTPTLALDCPKCAEWTSPQKPFRVFGNTYYVGTHAIGAILITSPTGHILIDGTVQEGAPLVSANIQALGFRVQDVRLILNTHVHFDHAGGIAALQKLSNAEVAASPWSAQVLMQGHYSPDDPLFDDHLRSPALLKHVRPIRDGEILSVGTSSVQAHFTPGHTPGGTSWAWRSCEDGRCLNIVYADSLSAVSAKSFLFSQNTTYSNVLHDFDTSFDVISALPCDILITNHPEFSDVLGRLQERNAGNHDAFINPSACRRYAEAARTALMQRLAQEAKSARK
jgi:metallo-beta-lactamase class B